MTTGAFTRYECPLCDWHYDEEHALPQQRDAIGATSIHEIVSNARDRQVAEVEAAIREHLSEAHTAPIVLAAT